MVKRIDGFHLCCIEVRHGDIDHERIIFVRHTGCVSVIDESQKADDEIENCSSHLFVGMCVYIQIQGVQLREKERKNANQSSSEREGGMLHLKRRQRQSISGHCEVESKQKPSICKNRYHFRIIYRDH